jgi:hypothetical protein
MYILIFTLIFRKDARLAEYSISSDFLRAKNFDVDVAKMLANDHQIINKSNRNIIVQL